MPQSGLGGKGLDWRLSAGISPVVWPGKRSFEARVGPIEFRGVRTAAQQASPAGGVGFLQEAMKTLLIAAASVVALAGSLQVQSERGTINKSPEADPVISAWYKSLTQPDDPTMSCCGEADAFEADSFEADGDHYPAIITNRKGLVADGTRIPVPNWKMKWDKGSPTGHGIIFLGADGKVFCYVTPSGL